MRIIKFEVGGLVNSFRIPETASYQNTELCPKKTHIAGLLSNIMGKNEKFYYKTLLPSILVGVIPLDLKGIFVDLWQYKKWKSSNIGGRAVVKREKLYQANYEIFVEAPENLINDIYKALLVPKRPPSLGMDDELVEIRNVKNISNDVEGVDMREERLEIYSIFPIVENLEYNPRLLEKNKLIIPPRIINVNTLFEFSIPRKPQNYMNIVEFFNCYCEIKSLPKHYPFKIIKYNNKSIVLW